MTTARGGGETTIERRGIKFDRLISILQKLIYEGPCTNDTLATEFGVSKKTIFRDMDVLTRLFPIRDELDPTDSRKKIWIIDSEELTRTRLSPEEQLALAVAKQYSPFGSVFGDTIEGIEKRLPKRQSPLPTDTPLLDAFVFTAAGDISADTLQKKLATLAKACVQSKCVHITYSRLFKVKISQRTIEPAYLFCSTDGFWYVTAFCQMAKKWLTFSVNQIQEYELLEEPSKNKLSGCKESDIADGFGAFRGNERTNVVVRFSPLIRPYIERRKWHISEMRQEVDDSVFGKGSLELQLTTTGLEGVKHWLKLWIPDFRVIEPASLRKELAEEMQKQVEHLAQAVIG